MLADARAMRLISRWTVPVRMRAQSIFWHWVDTLPCECRWPHGNCNDFPCPCARHKYDIH